MEMWEASGELEPIADWEPSVFDPDGRNLAHRLGWIAVILIAVGLLGGLGWYLTGWQEARRQAEIAGSIEAASGLQSAVTAARAAVEDLSDGTLAEPGVATNILGTLDAAARNLFDTASSLDPGNPATAEIRIAALEVAQQALDLETTIGDAIAYGASFELIAGSPDLPDQVANDRLPDVAADVAWWVGRFVDGSGSLPDHPLLDSHRTATRQLAAELPDWQAAYLDALRAHDAQTARVRIAELNARLAELDAGWVRAAEGVAEWGDQALDILRERLAQLTRVD